jgi:cytochrome c oxidase subunit 3
MVYTCILPTGITAIDPWALPLLGTCVLLASGFTVTAAHHAIVAGNKYSAIISLFFTVVLGFSFVALQGTEYYFAPFTITDSAFGTVFFMTTGLVWICSY